MRLPGFTADRSLERPPQGYRASTWRGDTAPGARVMPAYCSRVCYYDPDLRRRVCEYWCDNW